MDDFIKRSKYDLRETRFSQNYETSIELINHEDIDYQNPMLRNTSTSESPFKIKNSFSNIHHEESFIYMKEKVENNNDKKMNVFEKFKLKDSVKNRFTKSFSCFDDNILTRDSLGNLDQPVKYQSALEYLSNALQQDNSSDKSEQEDVFSEKLSIIRGLQQKLFSLQQKIKVSSVPLVNPYFEAIKLKVQKDYEKFSLPNCQQIKQNNFKFQIGHEEVNLCCQKTKKESEIKFIDKSGTNQSLESQSMLLDKDYSTSSKQISTLKINPSKILQPEVQFVQIIKLVEVPYLIEVARESQQKIESKKSFYFEQNEDIHKTFEEFTQKESQNDEMLNMETKIRPSTMQQHHLDFQLEYSGTNIIQNPSNIIDQNSEISMNESNKTFHNEIKQKRNDMSYNFDENSQILSKLLTKHNPSELQQFQQKLKSLQIQNQQLKQKINQKQNINNELVQENKLLTEELQSLIEFQLIYLEKLKQYEQKLQVSKLQFAQIHQIQSQKLKQHYEKIIQQYENQQSQYANRIIAFQELFQQNQNKQNNLAQFMEGQVQQIQYLQKLCQQKDIQIQNQANKRSQTEDIVVKRQTQLKTVIENLEKQNSQLKNLIKQIHIRYESQGFYILKEQAQEIKKTIEQKDTTHIQELQKLQNRYTTIIAKYQTQLQMMKKGLQKVRIDKSVSISRSLKSNNLSVQELIRQKNDTTSFKKRNSIFKAQLSSLNKTPKQNSSEPSKINRFNQLKMRHVESTEDSQTDIQSVDKISTQQLIKKDETLPQPLEDSNAQKFQQLLVQEINYLKEENSKLKDHLSRERQDKNHLSKKLNQIATLISKQISQLSESQSQLEKNQQVLEKCVEELQKQYEMNKQLKSELQKTKQLMKNQSKLENQNSQIMDQEQIKLHPTYLELNKKYIKSKKYIKVLEKQLLQLTLLPDFNQQTKQCCQNKDSIIKELKQIAFGKLTQSQTSI